MAENITVENAESVKKTGGEEPVNNAGNEQPKKKKGGAVKEWFRKFIVKLKRKTHMIPLVLVLIASLVYMCMLGTFSKVVEANSGIEASGICLFINTLVSILILPCFLNAFPKRKKPQIVYIVVIAVLLVLLIALDIMFYLNIDNYVYDNKISLARNPEINKAYDNLIIHIILVAVSGVAFAFLPLYKKGINKINTKKVIEENNLTGEIDTESEV